jgi:arginyl-tRNA synthetase
MSEDRFKWEIATSTAHALRELFSDFKDITPGIIYEKIEYPKKPEMGNYALPLFELAKSLRSNPVEINKKLVEAQNEITRDKYPYLTFSAAGGFNNVKIDTTELAKETLLTILDLKEKYGSSDTGMNRPVVLDFSSPNIAKPFGIGHLRSTAVGHSLYRLYNKLGYKSIGINHLGDWGTQFGKMIVAFRRWGNETELKDEPVEKLYHLYVKIHQEEENNPELADEARAAFKALEEGESEETELWKRFTAFSLESFDRTYDRLGIKFDYNTGESF